MQEIKIYVYIYKIKGLYQIKLNWILHWLFSWTAKNLSRMYSFKKLTNHLIFQGTTGYHRFVWKVETYLKSWPLSSDETSSMWTWSHSYKEGRLPLLLRLFRQIYFNKQFCHQENSHGLPGIFKKTTEKPKNNSRYTQFLNFCNRLNVHCC